MEMVQFRELTERYKLEKILKSTRGGTVLRAADLSSGQALAIKLIPLGSSTALEAVAAELERLAGTLTALRHPALPAVVDSGITSDGSAFLAMELLEGKGLDGLTGAPPARVLALLEQALNGLEVLAGKGLAHGSVSPDNLLVVDTPEGERVKLLGLGSTIFRPGPAADWQGDVLAFAETACRVLGLTVGAGDTPVVQIPLSLSFSLENDEALRQVLERALRTNPAERPSYRELREGLRLAVGRSGLPEPAPRVAAPAPAALTPPSLLSFEPPGPAPVIQAVPPPMPAMAPPAAMPPIRPQAAQPPPFLVPAAAPAPATFAAAAPPPPLMTASAPEPSALLEPPPSSEGDLLSLDDSLLDALMAPLPQAPSQPEPSPARKGKVLPLPVRQTTPAGGTGMSRPEPARTGFLRRPAVLGAIAGIVLLAGGGLGVFWFLKRGPAAETAAPVAAVPSGPPQRPAAERLEEALAWFAQGEDNRARLALESFTAADQASLSPARCKTLRAIEETLAITAVENLPRDLSAGLAAGDLGRLRTAVRAGEAILAELSPEVQQSYQKAKNVVEIYEQARAAAKDEKKAVVLERFASLDALLPDLSDPEDLRNKAAAALESKAEALVREAKYDEALAQLAPVITSWPDRTGLKQRVASYETYKQNEDDQKQLLTVLPGVERRKKPHEGLEAIAAVDPTPHLSPRFAEARKRFEEQLQALDRQPPQVILRDGYFLEYSRGTVHELSFRVMDDYLVKEVKFFARPEGGRMREMPLEVSRTGNYTVQIVPAVHGNGTVEFYVSATDSSGHKGAFGTEDRPQRLTRQQGFNRLVQ
jgi:tetratricopeptide (TPR) repeat protein